MKENIGLNTYMDMRKREWLLTCFIHRCFRDDMVKVARKDGVKLSDFG